MNLFLRCLSVEYQKTKHLSHIRLLHMLIPAGIAAVFLMYYRYVSWDPFTKLTGYFQVLGTGLPFLAGLFCSIMAQQEQDAGTFQNTLALPFRAAVFYGKLALLVLFCCLAVFAACTFFGAGFTLFVNGPSIPLFHNSRLPAMTVCVLYAAGIISAGGLWLYTFHLYLSFQFSGQLSIVLGILESLVSAILLTGLGDGIWIYLPCAWPSRLVSWYFAIQFSPEFPQSGFLTVCVLCVCCNMFTLAAFGIWSCRFEGRKTA